MQDPPKTTYLNAVITEVLRSSSIVPMNLWREATEDFSIGEYQIPKGITTVAQISVIMKDEKIFPDCETVTLHSLKHTLLDLWVAGQDTTANTLYWAFSYMTANPQFVLPLQNELDVVTNKTRPLSLQDRPKTPYLNAVITEVLRCSSILPQNLWREAAEDFSIGKYKVPKGTATVAQISVIMRDETIFPDCETFNPQRYINNPEYEQHVISFGLGKRSCLGESLARSELYLILGNLMCRFNFKASVTHPPGMIAKCDTSPGRKAKAYKVVISKRNTK